jgi:predicted metal-dependent enzyme (double-stranded beta helix superfamily)
MPTNVCSTKDWFITEQGECQLWAESHPLPSETTPPYRLYRFLTDLEQILDQETDDQLRLQAICPLVRRLLNSATWLQLTPLEPDPETGWNLMMLYDEPFYPITVQLVSWAPGTFSEIHNHGTWGLVALLSGQEHNLFWQPKSSKSFESTKSSKAFKSTKPQRQSGQLVTNGTCALQPAQECRLLPGDILCMMPNTIHQIEALGDEPTLSLNLYGETNFSQRFEFDPIQGKATQF